MSAILAPLAGKTISCSVGPGGDACVAGYSSACVGYAYVDSNGNPYTRVVTYGPSGDTGWVAGYVAQKWGVQASWGLGYPNLSTSGAQGGCVATWPAT